MFFCSLELTKVRGGVRNHVVNKELLDQVEVDLSRLQVSARRAYRFGH